MKKNSTGGAEEETTTGGVASLRPNGLEEEEPSVEIIQLTSHETEFDTGEGVTLNMLYFYTIHMCMYMYSRTSEQRTLWDQYKLSFCHL